MGDNLTRTENYLSLVGLVVLILGGIGVSSVTRVFVQQKVRSIAILKCVGTTSHQVLGVYLTQVLLLGLAGSLLGVAIAGRRDCGDPDARRRPRADAAGRVRAHRGRGRAGPGRRAARVAAVLARAAARGPARQAVAAAAAGHPAAADVRLGEMERHRRRRRLARRASRRGRRDRVEVGLLLSGGFVGIAFVLHLAGVALVRAVQPLRYARSFALRQAVLHIARPGNQTRVILLAVGLGTFFILGVRSLQANLLRDFSVQVGEDAPDMFLMDIQPNQRDGCDRRCSIARTATGSGAAGSSPSCARASSASAAAR